MSYRSEIRFLLNDAEMHVADVGAADMLLDFLRLQQRLTGSKEGCAEGDCGACSVLVGRREAGALRYRVVNACIRFLASLDGCHVVTIEHLAGPAGRMHPVQQAMVAHHASQCGFCTPGFVMALYALWMQTPDPSEHEIETALQGNLCRCTGYAPIIRAAQAISGYGQPADDLLRVERDRTAARLAALEDGARVEIARGTSRAILPADVEDLAAVLRDHPRATLIAGATDVGLWVTKSLRDISPAVFIGHLDALGRIEVGEDTIRLGAAVSYSAAAGVLCREYPHLRDYWNRIAGWQIRNMGTIGGNVANGSPIGDTPPVLIALGAEITLRAGPARRTLALEDFFIDYGRQDLAPGEFIETIAIPRPRQGWSHAAYKLSKRRDEDISSVAAAFALRVETGTIREARIAFGGMAATPKRARAAERALTGAPWEEASFLAAGATLGQDFTPLTDWRASADYRMRAGANLFRRFWLEQGPPDKPVRLSA